MTHEIRRLLTDHTSVEVQGDIRPYADYYEPEATDEIMEYEREPDSGEEPLNPADFLGDPFQISDLVERGTITEDQATVLSDIAHLQQEADRINQSSTAPRIHQTTRNKLQGEAAELSQAGDRLTSELFWLNPDDERHQQLIISLRIRFRNHIERPPARDTQDQADSASVDPGQLDSDYERKIDQLVDTGAYNYDEARRIVNGR